MQGDVLRRAQAVFCTTSGAASDTLHGETFDVCVIDEASQVTEVAAMAPLLKARRLILAGDHQQLPPFIRGDYASEKHWGRSLFEKLAVSWQ